MESVFLYTAAIGGGIFLLLLVLSMVGMEFDGDLDFDGGDAGDASGAFFGVLSIRAIVAAITFFGLGGLIAGQSGVTADATRIGIASGSGVAAMILVAMAMRAIHSLRSDGNLHIENAVGQTARVYLRIPASGNGQGKIQVAVQGRTVEYAATTEAAEEIPSGATVVVVGVAGPEQVRVLPVESDGQVTR